MHQNCFRDVARESRECLCHPRTQPLLPSRTLAARGDLSRASLFDVQPATLTVDPGAASDARAYGALLGAVTLFRFGAGRGEWLSGFDGAGAGSLAGCGIETETDTVLGYTFVVRIRVRQGDHLITPIQPSIPKCHPEIGESIYLLMIQDRGGVKRTHVIAATPEA